HGRRGDGLSDGSETHSAEKGQVLALRIADLPVLPVARSGRIAPCIRRTNSTERRGGAEIDDKFKLGRLQAVREWPHAPFARRLLRAPAEGSTAAALSCSLERTAKL